MLHVIKGLPILFLLTLIAILPSCKPNDNWDELSELELSSMQEYIKEIGSDYVYCMKAKVSNESYISVVSNRSLFKNEQKGRLFPKECTELSWWDISGDSNPEYANLDADDFLELIIRTDGIVYFSSQAW